MKKILLSLLLVGSSYIGAEMRLTATCSSDDYCEEIVRVVDNSKCCEIPINENITMQLTFENVDEKIDMHIHLMKKNNENMESLARTKRTIVLGEVVELNCPEKFVDATVRLVVTEE